MAASQTGELMLLVRESGEGAALMAYQLQGTEWVARGQLPSTALSPEVSGFRLALDSSARHLIFVGGEGPGFSALVHRWDLAAGQLTPLPLPALESWKPQRKALGIRLEGESLILVGPGVVRVELLTGQVRVLSEEVPDNLGEQPFIHLEGERLTLIPVGTEGAFETATLDLDAEQPQWISRPFLDASARTLDKADGILEGAEGARLIFKPQAEDADQEHRATLKASSPEVTLRILDADGALVAEAQDPALEKEVLFTPAADEPFYVIQATPTGNLDPQLLVSYALEVERVSGEPDPDPDPDPEDPTCKVCDDGGCRCSTGPDAGNGLGLVLLLLVLGLIRRRRP